MSYDFSNVQCNLPDSLAKHIIAWGEDNIPDDSLSIDPNSRRSGREDEMHVTVLYGIHSGNPSGVRSSISGTNKFTIELGKISLFTQSDAMDVIKIEVKSAELHRLNRKLKDDCEHTSKFPTYQPHVTVAYVKKGKGWKCAGNSHFDGMLFEVDHLIFSSKDGVKTKIYLA